MDGFSYMIISPEGEGYITYTAAYFRQRHFFLNDPGSFYKINSIIVVFFNACRDGKNVWVENNILGFKTYFFRENLICLFANGNSSLQGICLALLIKSHYHNGSAIGLADKGLFNEFCLPFLH